MDKNSAAKIGATVAIGLSTLWTHYKVNAARSRMNSWELLMSDLFGTHVTDADGTMYLVQDVRKIRKARETRKTNKKFDEIIENGF